MVSIASTDITRVTRYTKKIHWITNFKRVNFMLYELYLNKISIRRKYEHLYANSSENRLNGQTTKLTQE